MSDTHILFTAFSLIVAYMFLSMRVSSLVQPVRLEMADLGEEILACGKLDQATHRRVEFIIASLFSTKTAWLLTILYTPTVVMSALRRLSRKDNRVAGPRHSADVSRKLSRFQAVSMVVTLSNSPAAFVLLALQVIVGQLLFLPIKLSFGAAMDATKRTIEGTDRLLHRH